MSGTTTSCVLNARVALRSFRSYFSIWVYVLHTIARQNLPDQSPAHSLTYQTFARWDKSLNRSHVHSFPQVLIQPDSLAQALRRMFDRWLTPSLTSLISRIWSLRPPMLLHVMSPGSSVSMPCTDGSTSFGSTRITVKVVRSRDTRTWPFNFSFSICKNIKKLVHVHNLTRT